MQGLSIKRFLTELNDTNMYLVTDKASGNVILVDPSDSSVIRQYASGGNRFREVQIDYIILTHEHYDHIAALNEAREMFPECRVLASRQCSERIQNPRKNMSKYFNVILAFKGGYDAGRAWKHRVEPYSAEAADMVFESYLRMDWHGRRIELWEAPGHSPGSILIGIDGKHLFCGDSLSYDYEAVIKPPDGNASAYEELTKPLLRFFDGKMCVYPGHGRIFMLEEAARRLE